jgi:hypothetical protein
MRKSINIGDNMEGELRSTLLQRKVPKTYFQQRVGLRVVDDMVLVPLIFATEYYYAETYIDS